LIWVSDYFDRWLPACAGMTDFFVMYGGLWIASLRSQRRHIAFFVVAKEVKQSSDFRHGTKVTASLTLEKMKLDIYFAGIIWHF
jgi:hypothetical protein